MYDRQNNTIEACLLLSTVRVLLHVDRSGSSQEGTKDEGLVKVVITLRREKTKDFRPNLSSSAICFKLSHLESTTERLGRRGNRR